MIRAPAVAGRFYPDEPHALTAQIEKFCSTRSQKVLRPAIACMVPHAGYMYSGQVAGAVYAQLKFPKQFILIGPRHFPRGAAQAIMSEGAWHTPLGRAQIDAS